MPRGPAPSSAGLFQTGKVTMTTKREQPFFIDAKEVARLCGISRSMLYKQLEYGKVPAPRKIGRRVLWVYDEIRIWAITRKNPVAL